MVVGEVLIGRGRITGCGLCTHRKCFARRRRCSGRRRRRQSAGWRMAVARTRRQSAGRAYRAKARRRARAKPAASKFVEARSRWPRRRPCPRACSRPRCRPVRRRGAPAAGCRSLQAVHLRQAARLEQRRHQHHVAGAEEPVRQRLVVADGHAHRFGAPRRRAARKACFEPARRRCRAARAGRPGPAARRARPSTRCRPFCSVRRLTTHEQRRIGSGASPSSCCSAALQRALPAGRRASKRCGQQRVGGGVPDRVVDRVQDAGEHAGARAQQAVEAAALLRRLDLARVGRAHGGQPVGVVQAGLHERQLAVEFEPVRRRRPRRGRPSSANCRARKEPLVGQVVHGEHAGRPALGRAPAKAHVGRRQRRHASRAHAPPRAASRRRAPAPAAPPPSRAARSAGGCRRRAGARRPRTDCRAGRTGPGASIT